MAGPFYGAGKGPASHSAIHNHLDKKKNWPNYIQPMVLDETFNSMFLIDTREETEQHRGRTLDPFNNLLPKVAEMNVARNLKRSGPQQITTTRGAHLAVFMIQTTDKYQWTWAVTMDADEMNAGGYYDQYLPQVRRHEAFEPMTDPRNSQDDVLTVDLKFKYQKQWVSHMVLKSYLCDRNMTPETCAVQVEALEMMGSNGPVDPDDMELQLVVYNGWRVTAYTIAPDTPVVSMGPRGKVFKLSYPNVTFECRRVLKGGNLAMGTDGDRFSFLFKDHPNGLNLRGSRTSAPSGWTLLVNPRETVKSTCQTARHNLARVEGPDPTFEHAQLWTAHSRWMSQDLGDPNDPRRKSLEDPRRPNATRFEYDRYLELPNSESNFHVAFTRNSEAMPPVFSRTPNP
mgnify:FL=1